MSKLQNLGEPPLLQLKTSPQSKTAKQQYKSVGSKTSSLGGVARHKQAGFLQSHPVGGQGLGQSNNIGAGSPSTNYRTTTTTGVGSSSIFVPLSSKSAHKKESQIHLAYQGTASAVPYEKARRSIPGGFVSRSASNKPDSSTVTTGVISGVGQGFFSSPSVQREARGSIGKQGALQDLLNHSNTKKPPLTGPKRHELDKKPAQLLFNEEVADEGDTLQSHGLSPLRFSKVDLGGPEGTTTLPGGLKTNSNFDQSSIFSVTRHSEAVYSHPLSSLISPKSTIQPQSKMTPYMHKGESLSKTSKLHAHSVQKTQSSFEPDRTATDSAVFSASGVGGGFVGGPRQQHLSTSPAVRHSSKAQPHRQALKAKQSHYQPAKQALNNTSLYSGFNTSAGQLRHNNNPPNTAVKDKMKADKSMGFSGDILNIDSPRSNGSITQGLSSRMACLTSTQKQFIKRVNFDRNTQDAFALKAKRRNTQQHQESSPSDTQSSEVTPGYTESNRVSTKPSVRPTKEMIKAGMGTVVDGEQNESRILRRVVMSSSPQLRAHSSIELLANESERKQDEVFAEEGVPEERVLRTEVAQEGKVMHESEEKLKDTFHKPSSLEKKQKNPSHCSEQQSLILDYITGKNYTKVRTYSNNDELLLEPAALSNAQMMPPGAQHYTNHSHLNSKRSETSHEVWNAQSSHQNGGVNSPGSTTRSAYKRQSALYSYALSPNHWEGGEDTPQRNRRKENNLFNTIKGSIAEQHLPQGHPVVNLRASLYNMPLVKNESVTMKLSTSISKDQQPACEEIEEEDKQASQRESSPRTGGGLSMDQQQMESCAGFKIRVMPLQDSFRSSNFQLSASVRSSEKPRQPKESSSLKAPSSVSRSKESHPKSTSSVKKDSQNKTCISSARLAYGALGSKRHSVKNLGTSLTATGSGGLFKSGLSPDFRSTRKTKLQSATKQNLHQKSAPSPPNKRVKKGIKSEASEQELFSIRSSFTTSQVPKPTAQQNQQQRTVKQRSGTGTQIGTKEPQTTSANGQGTQGKKTPAIKSQSVKLSNTQRMLNSAGKLTRQQPSGPQQHQSYSTATKTTGKKQTQKKQQQRAKDKEQSPIAFSLNGRGGNQPIRVGQAKAGKKTGVGAGGAGSAGIQRTSTLVGIGKALMPQGASNFKMPKLSTASLQQLANRAKKANSVKKVGSATTHVTTNSDQHQWATSRSQYQDTSISGLKKENSQVSALSPGSCYGQGPEEAASLGGPLQLSSVQVVADHSMVNLQTFGNEETLADQLLRKQSGSDSDKSSEIVMQVGESQFGSAHDGGCGGGSSCSTHRRRAQSSSEVRRREQQDTVITMFDERLVSATQRSSESNIASTCGVENPYYASTVQIEDYGQVQGPSIQKLGMEDGTRQQTKPSASGQKDSLWGSQLTTVGPGGCGIEVGGLLKIQTALEEQSPDRPDRKGSSPGGGLLSSQHYERSPNFGHNSSVDQHGVYPVSVAHTQSTQNFDYTRRDNLQSSLYLSRRGEPDQQPRSKNQFYPDNLGRLLESRLSEGHGILGEATSTVQELLSHRVVERHDDCEVAFSSLQGSVVHKPDSTTINANSSALELQRRPTASFTSRYNQPLASLTQQKQVQTGTSSSRDMLRVSKQSTLLAEFANQIDHTDKTLDFINDVEKFTEQIQNYIDTKDEQMQSLINDRKSNLQYKKTQACATAEQARLVLFEDGRGRLTQGKMPPRTPLNRCELLTSTMARKEVIRPVHSATRVLSPKPENVSGNRPQQYLEVTKAYRTTGGCDEERKSSANQTQSRGPTHRTNSDHTYLSADGARVSFVTAKQTESEIREFERLKLIKSGKGTEPDHADSTTKKTDGLPRVKSSCEVLLGGVGHELERLESYGSEKSSASNHSSPQRRVRTETPLLT